MYACKKALFRYYLCVYQFFDIIVNGDESAAQFEMLQEATSKWIGTNYLKLEFEEDQIVTLQQLGYLWILQIFIFVCV